MVADEQNTNDFSLGFLVKDKTGQLKKIQDDSFIDAKPAAVSAPKPTVPSPAAPKTPPAPILTPRMPPAAPQPLAPAKPVSTSDKAAFYFSPEDEAEIQKHAESLKGMGTVPVAHPISSGALSGAAEKIRQQFKVDFNDETLNKRFGKVLESYFSDLRDVVETEEVLTRPQKIGGLAITAELAGQIMQAAQKQYGDIKKAAPQTQPIFNLDFKGAAPMGTSKPSLMAAPPPAFIPRPTPPKPMTAPTAPEAKKPIGDETKQLVQEIKKEIDAAAVSPKPLPAEKPVTVPVKEAVATPKPMETKKPEEVRQNIPKPIEGVTGIAYARQAEMTRPQMVDIRQPARVVGPVEELSFIDLKEFRKLSPNPAQASAKILEKIDLLQEESWQMRMDAIKAWKRSEAFQTYLDLGRESLTSGVSLAEIIRTRTQSGKPYLTLDEFTAINSLNSSLTM